MVNAPALSDPDSTDNDTVEHLIELADSVEQNDYPDKYEIYQEIIRTNRIIFIALPFFFAVILVVLIRLRKRKKE